jgi:hypothetical protein
MAVFKNSAGKRLKKHPSKFLRALLRLPCPSPPDLLFSGELLKKKPFWPFTPRSSERGILAFSRERESHEAIVNHHSFEEELNPWKIRNKD